MGWYEYQCRYDSTYWQRYCVVYGGGYCTSWVKISNGC